MGRAATRNVQVSKIHDRMTISTQANLNEEWANVITDAFSKSATPIHRAVTTKKSSNVPDRPLPPGYICYRCGEKGRLRGKAIRLFVLRKIL